MPFSFRRFLPSFLILAMVSSIACSSSERSKAKPSVITQTTASSEIETRFSYDDDGFLVSASTRVNGDESRFMSLVYADERLLSVVNENLGNPNGAQSTSTFYDYDEDGFLKEILSMSQNTFKEIDLTYGENQELYTLTITDDMSVALPARQTYEIDYYDDDRIREWDLKFTNVREADVRVEPQDFDFVMDYDEDSDLLAAVRQEGQGVEEFELVFEYDDDDRVVEIRYQDDANEANSVQYDVEYDEDSLIREIAGSNGVTWSITYAEGETAGVTLDLPLPNSIGSLMDFTGKTFNTIDTSSLSFLTNFSLPQLKGIAPQAAETSADDGE